MDWFFDKFGRDMVIADWLQRNQPEYVRLYQHILSKHSDGFEQLNELIFLAFETGIEFARASKREARVNVPESNYSREDD